MKRVYLFLIMVCGIIVSASSVEILLPHNSDILLIDDTTAVKQSRNNISYQFAINGLYYHFYQDSLLYFGSSDDTVGHVVANIHMPISAIAVDSANCIIAAANKLTLYTPSQKKLLQFHIAEDHITSLALSMDASMFYGTTSKLVYLDSRLHPITISNAGVRSLITIDSTLFVTFANDTVLAITHIDNFTSLADSLGKFKAEHPMQMPNYTTTKLNDRPLDMQVANLTVIPGRGLFGISGNALISVEPDKDAFEEYSFLDTFNIDEVVFLPSIPVFKSGKAILYINERKRLHGMQIDTKDFHIKQASDTSIFILNDNKVYIVNPRNGAPVLHMALAHDEKVLDFVPLQYDDTLIATTHNLFLLNPKGLSTLVSLPSEIKAVSVSAHGIFIGTNYGLYQYYAVNQLRTIAEEGIAQILCDNEFLYVITQSGYIYRLTYTPPTRRKKGMRNSTPTKSI